MPKKKRRRRRSSLYWMRIRSGVPEELIKRQRVIRGLKCDVPDGWDRLREEKSIIIHRALANKWLRRMAVLDKLAAIVTGIALVLTIVTFVFGGETSNPEMKIAKILVLAFFILSMAVSATLTSIEYARIYLLLPEQRLNFYRRGTMTWERYEAVLASYKEVLAKYREFYEGNDRKMDWAMGLLIWGVSLMIGYFYFMLT